MADILGWLSGLLGNGDPEAQGAAQASTAMQPAVLDHLQRMLSGQIAREGVLGQPRPYDPALSYRENVPDLRASLEPAIDVAMGVGPGAIRAFHGSPHDFSRFDMSKIGTGEGAQAYGHGLYFAESEPVARSYRDALTRSRDYSLAGAEGRVPDWLGNQIAQYPAGHEYYNGVIDRGLAEFRKRLAETQAEVKTSHQPWLAQDRIPGMQEIIDSLQKLRSGEATLAPRGRMYEVDINADPQRLLDWDKHLSEQPEVAARVTPIFEAEKAKIIAQRRALDESLRAQGRVSPFGPDNPVDAFNPFKGQNLTGGALYDKVATQTSLNAGRSGFDYPGASALLEEHGIPGIRYLDQGSRSGGQGTSNYVIFNDKLIDILRKYGIVPPLAGAGVLAAAGSEPPT